MTKKHYTTIAKIINSNLTTTRHRPIGEYVAIEKLANELSKAFKNDNPLFNEDIFLKACGADKLT